MKITCQSCQAKYTIADEKVAGKTVKIKCKKCGATIVVHGTETAAAPPAPHVDPSFGSAPLGGEGGAEEDGETRVFGHQRDGGAASNVDEWTVTITDDDQRTLTSAQIVEEHARGVIADDCYVWRDGMADWSPLSGVPELMALIQAQAAAAAPPQAAQPAALSHDAADVAFGGTVMMDRSASAAASPFAPSAPAPLSPSGAMARASATPSFTPGSGGAASSPAAAARRSGARSGAVDLFANAERAAAEGGNASGAAGTDRLIGERNENSVLFSLSALTAAENAQRGKPSDDEGILDLRQQAPATSKNNGRMGLDDIMNMGGGGMSAGPILAPPPLLAPVVEPPPMSAATAMVAPVMGLSSAGPYGGAPVAQKKKESNAVLLIGIVSVLAVAVGVGAFFALKAPGAPVAGTEATSAAATTTAAPSTATTVADPGTASAAARAPAPEASATAITPGAATAVTPGAAKPSATPVAGGPLPSAKPVDKPADKPVEKPADKPVEKPADPPAGGGREFDRAAAMAALTGASGAARSCKKDDGPTGGGKVKVTFAPSGNVTSSQVQGAPFAGTAVGGCVASAFRGAHVPAFDGAPVTVSKSFTIN